MAFASVPKASKNQINKAGERLKSEKIIRFEDISAYADALELAGQWRACHAYPINTFQATLRDKVRGWHGEPIVAQRLKRMPTIIDKLRRYPAMKLTTMHDIAGIRAILESVEQVQELAEQYRKSRKLEHELSREDDYIAHPRDTDGYRSIHLIYKYRNARARAYDGLRLELQLRTRLQHMWATAVETMGTLLGQALKSRQGDQDWLDFFAIVSSAFAHMEKTTRIPRFSALTKAATFAAVAEAEGRINALDIMGGVSSAVSTISKRQSGGQSSFYHLIILDSLNRRVEIKPYDRDSVEKATRDYTALEARAASGEKIEPVLVSAGPIDKLRRAYPSFFLDIEEFVRTVATITKPRSSTLKHA
jgi:hypothetical protein